MNRIQMLVFPVPWQTTAKNPVNFVKKLSQKKTGSSARECEILPELLEWKLALVDFVQG